MALGAFPNITSPLPSTKYPTLPLEILRHNKSPHSKQQQQQRKPWVKEKTFSLVSCAWHGHFQMVIKQWRYYYESFHKSFYQRLADCLLFNKSYPAQEKWQILCFYFSSFYFLNLFLFLFLHFCMSYISTSERLYK